MKISEIELDQVIYCSSNISIPEVAKLLYENFIRAIYIKENDKIIGYISDQLILRNLSEGKELSKLNVKDLMISDFPRFDKNTSIEDAYKAIQNITYRLYAVVSDGEIIGVIPKNRLIRAFSEEEKYQIYNFNERIKQIKL